MLRYSTIYSELVNTLYATRYLSICPTLHRCIALCCSQRFNLHFSRSIPPLQWCVGVFDRKHKILYVNHSSLALCGRHRQFVWTIYSVSFNCKAARSHMTLPAFFLSFSQLLPPPPPPPPLLFCCHSLEQKQKKIILHVFEIDHNNCWLLLSFAAITNRYVSSFCCVWKSIGFFFIILMNSRRRRRHLRHHHRRHRSKNALNTLGILIWWVYCLCATYAWNCPNGRHERGKERKKIASYHILFSLLLQNYVQIRAFVSFFSLRRHASIRVWLGECAPSAGVYCRLFKCAHRINFYMFVDVIDFRFLFCRLYFCLCLYIYSVVCNSIVCIRPVC